MVQRNNEIASRAPDHPAQLHGTCWRFLCAALAFVVLLTGTACGNGSNDDPSSDDPSLPHLAFVSFADDGSNTDIFIADAQGGGLRRLTSGPDHDGHPAWSSARQQIVFVRGYADGNGADIFAIDIDGSGLTNLTNNARVYESPTWSPDGNEIAFLAQADDELREWVHSLFVMDASGAHMRRLSFPPLSASGPLSWSPDSVHIAVRTYDDAQRGVIRLVRSDGTGDQVLTRGDLPAWSPDGSRIAFLSDFEGNIFTEFSHNLSVIDIDGSSPTVLTRVRNAYDVPAWSPDGRQIAFSHDAPGAPEYLRIHVINADGSGLAIVSHSGRDRHDRHDRNPSWSPDGSLIAFSRMDDFSNADDVWVVGVDSKHLTDVSSPRRGDAHPIWLDGGT